MDIRDRILLDIEEEMGKITNESIERYFETRIKKHEASIKWLKEVRKLLEEE